MKSIIRMFAATLLFALLVIVSPAQADQAPAKSGKSDTPMTASLLLEKAQTSGSFPEGMIVRIGACLGAADGRGSGDRVPDELRETWEFTSGLVYRVVPDDIDGKPGYRRVESSRFDSKDICKDLLTGKAIEIQARKGEGREIALVGSRYRIGSRSIEVIWQGKTILDLHETNGPVLDRYRESDARAFATLYERLAGQARGLFKPTSGEGK